jgi:Sec-independent protein secretion pathway component TatC
MDFWDYTLVSKGRTLPWHSNFQFLMLNFAEVATPISDPIIAPLVVMIPLVILYEASVLVAVRIEAGQLKRSKSQGISG